MQKEMNIQAVTDDIRDLLSLKPGLIRKIGIFGSLARGDFHEGSDIDLLVEYNSPPVFSMDRITDYCELCNKMEETLAGLYQRNVDIAHFENDSLENMYDPDIAKDVIWI